MQILKNHRMSASKEILINYSRNTYLLRKVALVKVLDMAENKTHYSFGTYSLVDLREYLLSWSHIFFSMFIWNKKKEKEQENSTCWFILLMLVWHLGTSAGTWPGQVSRMDDRNPIIFTFIAVPPRTCVQEVRDRSRSQILWCGMWASELVP